MWSIVIIVAKNDFDDETWLYGMIYINGTCYPGDHYSNYCSDALSLNQVSISDFQVWVPVDKISECPIVQ